MDADTLYALESRLDDLEERVRKLGNAYDSYQRTQDRRIQQARYQAARTGSDTVTPRDMQRMKGVSAQVVRDWTDREDFPAPVQAKIGNHPALWARDQFEAWYEQHIRKPQVRAALKRRKEREK